MAISTRTKRIIRRGISYTPIILIEFDSYLTETWGRLSPYGTITISDDVNHSPAQNKRYYDYFAKGLSSIKREIDILFGGLGRVGNVDLILNNSADLMQDLRAEEIENTQVSIYLLLDIGGTKKRSNCETRFVGTIDTRGMTWDSNTIRIRIIDPLWKKDSALLKNKITVGDYPAADKAAIDQYIPVVGGDWEQFINTYYAGGGGSDLSERDIFPPLTSPALLRDAGENEYFVADHPIKNLAVPTATASNDVGRITDRRAGSGVVRLFSESDQLMEIYNASFTNGDQPYFIITQNAGLIYGFVKPHSGKESKDLPGFKIGEAYDDNGFLEKGVNDLSQIRCRSIPTYRGAIAYSFRFTDLNVQIPEAIFDEHPHFRLYLYIIARAAQQDTETFLYWVIVTDGNGYYWEPSGVFPDGDWLPEDGIRQYYLVQAESQLLQGPERWKAPVGSDWTYIVSGDLYSRLNYYYAGIWGWMVRRILNFSYPYSIDNELTFFPPSNIRSLSFEGRNDVANWAKTCITPDNLSQFSFGLISSADSFLVQTFGLAVGDIHHEGGTLPKFIPSYKETQKTIKLYNLLGQEVGTKVITTIEEPDPAAYDEYLRRKEEIENITNLGPIGVMIKGYTDDNTSGGTVVQEPIDHMNYLLEYRVELTADTDWDDAGTFTDMAANRVKTIDDDFEDQWEFHYYLTRQVSIIPVLKKMAYEMNAFLYHRDGKLFVKSLDWFKSGYIAAAGVVAQFDENDINEYKFTKQTAIYDSFEIEYAKSATFGDRYMRRLKITPFESNWYNAGATDFPNLQDPDDPDTLYPANYDIADVELGIPSDPDSTTMMGRCYNVWLNFFKRTVETDLTMLKVTAEFIASTHTARRLLYSLIRKFTKVRPIIEFVAGIKAMELEQGDIIYITHADFASTDKTTYQIFAIEEVLPEQTYIIRAIQIGND